MSVIQIEDVQREGARLLIMICGVSGGGKTFTAIQLGLGLANGDASKLGFLDTENGRGRLYADKVSKPFKYGELKPPFSPNRYIAAIEAFAKTGVEVLIIDSGTHEYEGIGGIQEIAEGGNPRMPNWNKAKAEHKKFMSALLASPMHIILCLRAREKSKPEKQIVDGREKTVYVDYGLQPITEKNTVFEASASIMIHDQGKRQEVIKCPDDLLPYLGRQSGYITADDGRGIRAWVDGAKQLNPEVEKHRGLLEMAAENGIAALQKAWTETPLHVRKLIDPKGCPETLKESAAAFDRQRKEAAEGGAASENAAVGALNAAAATVATPAQNNAPAAQETEPAGQGDDDNEVF